MPKEKAFIQYHELYFVAHDNKLKFNASYKKEDAKFIVDCDVSGKRLLNNIKNATEKQ